MSGSGFSITANNCGSTLAAGSSCTISVVFSPTTTGAGSATLTVVDAVGTQNSTLTATAVVPPAPRAALTPSTAGFNSFTVGVSSPVQAFTLTNAGTAALSIASVSITGTNASAFSVTATACGNSLAAGSSCTIGVVFTPMAAGSESASLNVVDAVGTQSATLTGTGTAPQASLTSPGGAFGSVTVGSTSSVQTFTLTNAGNAALSITSVGFYGDQCLRVQRVGKHLRQQPGGKQQLRHRRGIFTNDFGHGDSIAQRSGCGGHADQLTYGNGNSGFRTSGRGRAEARRSMRRSPGLPAGFMASWAHGFEQQAHREAEEFAHSWKRQQRQLLAVWRISELPCVYPLEEAHSMNDVWEFNPAGTKHGRGFAGTRVDAIPGATNHFHKQECLASMATKGVPASTNTQAAAGEGTTWTDSSGNFWLFGGSGSGCKRQYRYSGRLYGCSILPQRCGRGWRVAAIRLSATAARPCPLEIPLRAAFAVGWVDKSNDLWLFGGEGYTSADGGFLNDLWKFNTRSSTWTQVSGGTGVNAVGVYGNQGVPSTGNVPSARIQSTTWRDGDGNLWLFGGYINVAGSTAYYSLLNDLWKFNPADNTWTWESGNDSTGRIRGTHGTTRPALYCSNNPRDRISALSWIDGNWLNLWLFGGSGVDSTSNVPSNIGPLNDVWKYDPVAKTWIWMNGSSVNSPTAVYGTRGVPSATAAPIWKTGCRQLARQQRQLLDSTGGSGTGLEWRPRRRGDLWEYPAYEAFPGVSMASAIHLQEIVLIRRSNYFRRASKPWQKLDPLGVPLR